MTVQVEVIGLADVEDALEKFSETISEAFPGICRRSIDDTMMSSAKERCPRKTGTLARSITWRHVETMMGTSGAMTTLFEFGPGVYYGIYVEFGTATRGEFKRPAYEIKPRAKKALWWKGLKHPIKRVKAHPGMAPRPFMRPAFDLNKTYLPKLIEAKLREKLISLGKEGGKS